MIKVTTLVLPGSPMGWVERQVAAEAYYYYLDLARKGVAEAEKGLLAAKTPEEKTAAEQKFLEAHRELAKAKDWKP